MPFVWNGLPVRAILLDMDGTMADTKHAHAEAWEHWAKLHGIEISKEEYMPFYDAAKECWIHAERSRISTVWTTHRALKQPRT